MKSPILLLVISVFIYKISNAQTFETETSVWSQNNDVLKTRDGGYVLFAPNYDTSSTWHTYVIKFDSTGTIRWSRRYAGLLASPAAIGQNNFAIYHLSDTTGLGIVWDLIILDSQGYIISAKAIADTMGLYSMHSTSDMGTITLGILDPAPPAQQKYIIIKTDSSGTVQWEKTFESGYEIYLNEIIETYDGGYIADGIALQFPDTSVATVVRFNSTGDTLWRKTYGSQGKYVSNSKFIRQVPQGFLISGIVHDTLYHDYISLIDSLGILQWSEYIPDQAQSNYHIWEGGGSSTDNGFVFLAGVFSQGSYAGLVKTDVAGNIEWVHGFYSTVFIQSPKSLIQTDDNGYIFPPQFTGGPNIVIGLIKTDSLGNTGCDTSLAIPTITGNILYDAQKYPQINMSTYAITTSAISLAVPDTDFTQTSLCLTLNNKEIIQEEVEFIIYPNPTSSTFTVSSTTPLQNAQIEIFNLLGEKIYSTAYREQLTVSSELFPPGIYFISLHTDKGTSVQKLIKQ